MKKTIYLLSLMFVIISCSDAGDDPQTPSDGDGYDRSQMMQSLADNLIIPGYEELHSTLNNLKNSKDAYLSGSASLEQLKTDWHLAYQAWQAVEVYNIGPSEDLLYPYQMNIYPTNLVDIQNNIESGNYDLSSPNNNDAVGFPAVEYLLYSYDNLDTPQAQSYLSDLVDRMESLTNQVLSGWNNGYRETFISSTDNTATSAVNMFVNDYIYYVEKGFRANKIGIPAGVFSTSPLPDRVESLYAQSYSKELCLLALDQIEAIFSGNPTGLEDYLDFLGNAPLAQEILEQIQASRIAIDPLNDNFFQQVETNNTAMLLAYDEIQKLVVLLKVDMLQELNISVDYVDADGD